MKTIVLNASNLVNNGLNNQFVYLFPNSVSIKNSYMSVASVAIYYSWYNISLALGNNSFTYTWTSGTTTTTYSVIIPDGIYQISDLNSLFQYTMITNGHYLVNSSGQNVYYVEFIVNPTRYAVQLNTFLVPTSLPTGYTQPAGFAGFPTTARNSVVTIPPISPAITGLGVLLGFKQGLVTAINAASATTGTYVSTNSAGTISYISTSAPNIQPNSSLLFSSTGIDNNYSVPNSIIYSISPNVGVGSIITDKPPNYLWNKMYDGFYNQLTITILGTNLQPIQLNDPSTTIMLTIATAEERGLK